MLAFNWVGVSFIMLLMVIFVVTWAVLSYHERKDALRYMDKKVVQRYHNDW